MKIGIIGYGVVGKAVTEAFRQYHTVYVYDVRDIKPEKNCSLKFLAQNCEAIFLCVPTPYNHKAKSVALGSIMDILVALEDLNAKCLIVIKSSVPPKVTDWLHLEYPCLRLACNPEFLREKTAYEDMLVPDRIVLGTYNPIDLDVLQRVYERWSCHKIFCDPTSAETIKMLSNAFLVSKVAFACETARICKIVDADQTAVYDGLSSDKRIGKSHLNPDLGVLSWSSPCLPKDLATLISCLDSYGFNSRYLKNILETGVEKQNGQ